MDNRTSSLLDGILVTKPERVTKSGVKSDCLSDNLTGKLKSQVLRLIIRLREGKTYECRLFINWDRFQLIPFVDDAWNLFYPEVTKIIDNHAFMKANRVKGRHLPWISRHLLSRFKQKQGIKPGPIKILLTGIPID